MHARKRRVGSFEKREKDVKRGKNKEKSMCMEKKGRKKNRKVKKIEKYVYERKNKNKKREEE
jgi:hypothetical protein